jgi:flagellar hook protein FlgE
MLRSLNSGVSGLKAFQTKLDVIGNNIANINTVGYKKGQVVFQDIFSQTLQSASAPTTTPVAGGTNPIQVGLGTSVSSIKNVFTPGTPMATYNSTDLYIDGDAFFAVQGGGTNYYTRAGNFTVDQQGYLVNSDGMYVLDASNNKITLPTNAVSFSVAPDGKVNGVDANGNIVTGTQSLKLVYITNPESLRKEGNSLYRESANTRFAATGTANLISGYLEMSNVDISEEMTDMIVAQRGFQANSKIITVSDQILEEVINLKR